MLSILINLINKTNTFSWIKAITKNIKRLYQDWGRIKRIRTIHSRRLLIYWILPQRWVFRRYGRCIEQLIILERQLVCFWLLIYEFDLGRNWLIENNRPDCWNRRLRNFVVKYWTESYFLLLSIQCSFLNEHYRNFVLIKIELFNIFFKRFRL